MNDKVKLTGWKFSYFDEIISFERTGYIFKLLSTTEQNNSFRIILPLLMYYDTVYLEKVEDKKKSKVRTVKLLHLYR